MAPQKINIKERVTDGEIDLSMSDLQEVPVREIAVFKKAPILDLSNNHLKILPNNFASLTHLTKLDLSKNQLVELPENFGELVKLKHLDLYQNQLQYLPLSFGKLKALKWLDLKDNPLVPAVAKVSGPCLDAKQCQTCAKDVVNFFTQVQEQIATDLENRQKEKQKQQEVNQQKQMDNKKAKKKEKNVNNKQQQKKENGPSKTEFPKSKKNRKTANSEKHSDKSSNSLFRSLFSLFLTILFVLFVLTSINYPHTIFVEKTCVDLYTRGLEVLPTNLQAYWLQVGSYFHCVHNKTGNITLEVVQYVKNTDNFVNAYDALGSHIEALLNKIKEQYKKYVA